jgi:ribonuclease HII
MRPDAEVSRTTRKLRMLRTLICDDSYERAAQASGALRIAGVDEVGRGALFGPVVAAAVILPPGCHAAVLQAGGLRDSKQLEAQDRERLAAIVRDCAVAIAIAEVDAATIDRVNIYQATRLAMLRAIQGLTIAPDHLLIDALRVDHPCAQSSIVYGDARSLSIELHREYPVYGLDEHKGYGTPAHQRALLRHGPSTLHRRSFRPVWESALPWDACQELPDSPS